MSTEIDVARVPVIVGVGQVTDTSTPVHTARSPIELMRDASIAAAADSGAGALLLRGLDSVTVVRLFADSVPRFESPFGQLVNPPWSLSRRLDANPSDLVYPPMGGDSPLTMLVRACERIARGESQAALIAGGESLRTELAARRAGFELRWGEDAPVQPQSLAPDRPMYTEQEALHGMRSPIAMYALIGQALRAASGQSVAEYMHDCGLLFERLAAVARQNPLATRREGYSADDLTRVTPENPYIGFPYTKRMIASAYIDQSAAIVVVSSARADELGIPHARRVYLHAAAHAHEQWFVSERQHLASSRAMQLTASAALDQAGKELKAIGHFDLYSCFPSAIQLACKELGLRPDDARNLTVTGGLPFFGGPGNNYVTHAIAEMVLRLREDSGSSGLVLANGGLATKEAVGILSSTPPRHGFVCDDASLQAQIDREPTVRVADRPYGLATVETYSVLHGKAGPEAGLIFGRLVETGERFVANTPVDESTLAALEERDAIGILGRVSQDGKRNLFVPQFNKG